MTNIKKLRKIIIEDTQGILRGEQTKLGYFLTRQRLIIKANKEFIKCFLCGAGVMTLIVLFVAYGKYCIREMEDKQAFVSSCLLRSNYTIDQCNEVYFEIKRVYKK